MHGVLPQLRAPSLDSAKFAVTELGDAQVQQPVIMTSFAWLVWRRLWWTGLYWLAAVGVTQFLVKVLKVALHRSRPVFCSTAVRRASPRSHAKFVSPAP